ncbi:hypothetical protein RCL1_002193 [Eukaryota sp. TZLM3-RCL]
MSIFHPVITSDDGSISIVRPDRSVAVCRTCLKSGGFNTVASSRKGRILLSFNPQGIGTVNSLSGAPLLVTNASGVVYSSFQPSSSSSSSSHRSLSSSPSQSMMETVSGLESKVTSCFAPKPPATTLNYPWSWFLDPQNSIEVKPNSEFVIKIDDEFNIILIYNHLDFNWSVNLARPNTTSTGTYLNKVKGFDIATRSYIFDEKKLRQSGTHSPLIPKIIPQKSKPFSLSGFKEVSEQCEELSNDLKRKLEPIRIGNSKNENKRSKLKSKIQQDIAIMEQSLDLQSFSLYQSRKELRAKSRDCRRSNSSLSTDPVSSHPLLSKFHVPLSQQRRSKVADLHWSNWNSIISKGNCFISILIDSSAEKECRRAVVALEKAQFELNKDNNSEIFSTISNFSLYTYFLRNSNYENVISSYEIVDFPAFLCFINGNLVFAQYNLIGNVIDYTAVLATLVSCRDCDPLPCNYKFPPSSTKIAQVANDLDSLNTSFKNRLI